MFFTRGIGGCSPSMLQEYAETAVALLGSSYWQTSQAHQWALALHAVLDNQVTAFQPYITPSFVVRLRPPLAAKKSLNKQQEQCASQCKTFHLLICFSSHMKPLCDLPPASSLMTFLPPSKFVVDSAESNLDGFLTAGCRSSPELHTPWL